jgi:hypothetical protein
MSRRKTPTTTRLTSAIGVLYAEVRTRTVVSSEEREAQLNAEATCQTLLESPLLVRRLAELMDTMP